MKLLSILAIAITALPLCAVAQTAYRCGNTYSEIPCPGAVHVPVDDSRTAEQRAQAEATAKRDGQLAASMEKDRLKQEAQETRVARTTTRTVVVRSDTPTAEAQKPVVRKGKKKKEPEYFTAVVPKKPGEKAGKSKKNKPTNKAATRARSLSAS